MSKAILVMDMPSGCNECDIMCQQYYATIKKEELKCGTKPHNCPLKPMPEEDNSWSDDEYYDDWTMGYNACIKKILGD